MAESSVSNSEPSKPPSKNETGTMASPPDKESSSSVSDSDSPEAKKERSARFNIRLQRYLPAVMLLFYTVGVVWHLLHPLVSVCTWDAVPRKWYIDENSLDPSYLQMDQPYPAPPERIQKPVDLCELTKGTIPIPCYKALNFSVARIVSVEGAIAPTTETVVLVFGRQSPYAAWQHGIRTLMERLSTVSWNSKSVMVVMANVDSDDSLSTTVESFLNCYLGADTPNRDAILESALCLPPEMTGSMLRTVLVLDTVVEGGSRGNRQIRILPQGRHGVLPNMDLVFLSTYVYRSAKWIAGQTSLDGLIMHPHREWKEWFYRKVMDKYKGFTPDIEQYLRKLLDLELFQSVLRTGPFPPHHGALDRGIDSLTIQAVATGKSPPSPLLTLDFVQRIELMLRSISNLHERLHHSTSLYLLVNSERFVKHEEYLIPNILLLVPVLLRAVQVVFFTEKGVQLNIVVSTLAVTVILTILVSLVLYYDTTDYRALLIAFYVLVWIAWQSLSMSGRLPEDRGPSIQFAACLMTIWVHAPIIFGHVSLAFPSALFWSLWFSLPTAVCAGEISPLKTGLLRTLGRLARWLVSTMIYAAMCTVLVLVPEATIYLQVCYCPLLFLVGGMYGS